MIGDEGRLGEVIEEIAEWPLEKRRRYIQQIESASGKEAANQIRAELKRIWEQRDR